MTDNEKLQNGDVGTVGITAYATKSLGDIVFVDLPSVGDTFEAGYDLVVTLSCMNMAAQSQGSSAISSSVFSSSTAQPPQSLFRFLSIG